MSYSARRPSILWHLYEEGTLSVFALAQLTGWNTSDTRTTVVRAVHARLVEECTPRTKPHQFRLTPLGKEEAASIPQSEVDFALGKPVPIFPKGKSPDSKQESAYSAAPKVFAATDLVCAINSLGELVLDLGGESNVVVQLPPQQTQVLRTFMDNTAQLRGQCQA